jgi:hypothetical protein
VDEGITIEDKLETILQQNKIEVDSLYYISPQHTFLDVIKWYKQRITITYSCIKCDAGRDICFNADEKIPTLIKAFCPICESDLILKEHTKPIEVKCSLKYVLDKYLYLVQEYIKSDYSIEKSAQISSYVFNFDCDIEFKLLGELRLILNRSIPGSPMEKEYSFTKTKKLIEDISSIYNNSQKIFGPKKIIETKLNELIKTYSANISSYKPYE